MQYTPDQAFPGTLKDEQEAGPSLDERLAAVMSPMVKADRQGFQAQYVQAKPQGAAPRPRLARTPLSNSHNGPRLEYAIGGTYAKLCIPGIESPTKPAKRGRITDFSEKSRRKMLDTLSKVDHDQLAPYAYFATFTWPCTFPKDRRIWAACKRAFLKRLRREYSIQAVVWKLEPQQRLAPHYHLLIFSHDEIDNEWIAHAWHDVVGTEDHNHLLWHLGELADPDNKPCTSRVNSFDGVKHYVSEYCGKKINGGDLPPWWHGGRWWGVEGDLPTNVHSVDITTREALDLRRWMRQWYKSKVGRKFKTAGMGGVKVYTKHHTIERMLAYAAKRERERADKRQPDLVDLHLLASRGNKPHTRSAPTHDERAANEQSRLERFGIQHKTPEDCRTVMDKYGFSQVEQAWSMQHE